MQQPDSPARILSLIFDQRPIVLTSNIDILFLFLFFYIFFILAGVKLFRSLHVLKPPRSLGDGELWGHPSIGENFTSYQRLAIVDIKGDLLYFFNRFRRFDIIYEFMMAPRHSAGKASNSPSSSKKKYL